VAVTLTFFAMFGSMFLLTQYMQYVLGFTPLEAGVRSIPVAMMLMIGGPMAARLTERFGTKRMVSGGLFVVAAGLAVASTATPELGYLARVLPAQLLLGLGISLAMAPATESIMGSLPRDMAGVGSAVNDTTRQIGGAMGVAIIGSIFASAYRPAVDSSLGSLAGTMQQAPGGGEALAAVRDSIGGAFGVAARAGGDPRVIDTEAGRQIAAAAQDAFAHSMGRSMLVAAAFALAGALIALAFLPATAVAAGDDEPLEADDPRLDRQHEPPAERELVPAS
jgi:Na+/melibiose symporter-like transporter